MQKMWIRWCWVKGKIEERESSTEVETEEVWEQGEAETGREEKEEVGEQKWWKQQTFVRGWSSSRWRDFIVSYPLQDQERSHGSGSWWQKISESPDCRVRRPSFLGRNAGRKVWRCVDPGLSGSAGGGRLRSAPSGGASVGCCPAGRCWTGLWGPERKHSSFRCKWLKIKRNLHLWTKVSNRFTSPRKSLDEHLS